MASEVTTVALVQPSDSPRMIPNVRPKRPAPARPRPRRSSALSGPCDSVSILPGERDQREPDRDVEPEDPLPRDPLDDGAADERADRDAEAADPAPDPERRAAPLGRERLGDQGQGERGDDRRAESLQGSRRDQRVDRGRQRRQGRGAGEDPDADPEHPLAAEPVAERGAGDQQHRERQRVGVDRPLERLDRAAEVRSDRRQRDADDEVVERRHEERRSRDRERPSRRSLACLLGLHPIRLLRYV